MTSAVLGVGNVLLSDEGIGVRVVETLGREYTWPQGLELLDGGTTGMELLEPLEGLDCLIIADAVRVGQEPGSVAVLRGDQVPAFFRTKLSPHQIGLSDVLATLALTGQYPGQVVVVGLQPVSLATGMELTPAAQAALPLMVRAVVAELAAQGITPLSGPASGTVDAACHLEGAV